MTIRTVQVLRVFACLLVVTYHTVDARWPNGSAGVDLFFVISGLVMGLSSEDLVNRPDGWRIFIVRRVRRLVPLYWCFTSAKLGIGWILPSTLALAHPGPWNVIASFLFVPSRDGAGIVRPVLGVGWTLQFEMLFYIIFALGLALRRSPLGLVGLVLGPLALAGFWRQADWPAPLFLANGLVLEFCLGLALARQARFLASLPAGVCWSLALVGLCVMLNVLSGQNWRFLCWGVPAACVVAGALGLERTFGPRVPRFLMTLGEASYAIYLVHPFIVPGLVRIVARALGDGADAIACQIGVDLLVCSVIGWAVYRWVDRPLQSRLRLPKRIRDAGALVAVG